ncbi:MAG: hypothetical protein Q4A15_06400 [Prevotellaceae bacterium]|nr:hypothetical protein [Prevotellaceae bacterium]
MINMFIVFGNSIINSSNIRNVAMVNDTTIVVFGINGDYVDSESYENKDECQKALNKINDILGGIM